MNERAIVRPYRPSDRDDLYDVCVRTGHQGGDARELYADHDLLPDVFAGPYAELEPDLAFVLDDGERVVGYVVGAADTAVFAERFRTEWLPRVAGRHPAPSGPPTTPDELVRGLLHRPGRMVVPELADHPAHLHIDLLPAVQRKGYGRELMDALFAALRERGVAAVHLGMAPQNTAAGLFYERLGFRRIDVPGAGDVTYLGRTTAPLERR
ncbi:GNAT family N-acetyltransferase [Streptomyces sp. TRM 70351]|uniref:GNAT family N-acetyltransferase n=1 Tax=Streptomyces sp. TRM 70351 TaxID=3116552 RepID=UPI002E7B584B|nr:GNAT family N-acetyltransferase [Streptomyces sp. TRM 70351]MEE1928491.1 GNAT family N-acetyltransferase [Streptomyces sp. TRM 70351]